jgi:dipeptidase
MDLISLGGHFMKPWLFVFAAFACLLPESRGCTNLLVGKKASADGSVIITYTCDGEFHPTLRHTPAARYPEGATFPIRYWDGTLLGSIPQVRETYSVFGLMNEHQVVIGETTFDGRLELQNKEGLLHYWEMMKLALLRSKTAREAIAVMTSLVAKHGYRSTGESFSIGDPNEAWILEMIGKGPQEQGAVWVAVRIPDDHISAHANAARIGSFPLNDPEHCLYSEDVIEFAVRRGYFDPEAGRPFAFNEVYCPLTPQRLRYTETRVWSLFNRAAPSQAFDPAFHRGQAGAPRYPLTIRPDQPLTLEQVMALMRDHYEGTPYDMTQGLDAGPFGTPNRWRPMTFQGEDPQRHFSWERPISTQQTGFSFISQSRSFLPNAIGGVYWYGLDDTYTTVYMPFYCQNREIPKALSHGTLKQFDRQSAWWIFNYVANLANLKYTYMIQDIQAVQKALESDHLALQAAVEETALHLLAKDPELMGRYLDDYCTMRSQKVIDRWLELGDFLLTKYNDGYIQNDQHQPQEVGYPRSWLERVIQNEAKRLELPKQERPMEAPEHY